MLAAHHLPSRFGSPAGATEAPAEKTAAADIRDRMWTLIKQRHEHLRQAGVVVFGLPVLDGHVPPLGSRTRAPAKLAAEPAPAAPAGPTP